MKLYDVVLDKLDKLGVSVENMAEVVVTEQLKWIPDMQLKDAINAIEDVLKHREVLNATLVALQLDELSASNKCIEPLQTILTQDAAAFSVDEQIALSICNIGGSIAVTSYGHLDITKPGIIGELNKRPFTVFTDDVVGAIIATAQANILHASAKYDWE